MKINIILNVVKIIFFYYKKNYSTSKFENYNEIDQILEEKIIQHLNLKITIS